MFSTNKSICLFLVILITYVAARKQKIAGSIQFKNNHTYQFYEAVPSTHPRKKQHEMIKLIVAQPNDACKKINQVQIGKQIFHSYPIYVIVNGSEGACTYQRRINMIQSTGVDGVIIIHSDNSKNNLKIDYQRKLQILFIDLDQANEMIQTDISQGVNNVYINFKKLDQDKIQIWTSSLDQKSYDYIEYWDQARQKIPYLKQKVKWLPRYSFVSCYGQNCANIASCACEGMFCSPVVHKKTPNILVKQDFRQHLLFQYNSQAYFRYMKLFKRRCLKQYKQTFSADDCSKAILQAVTIQLRLDQKQPVTPKVQKFVTQCDNSIHATLLSQMVIDLQKSKQIQSYPSIFLNHNQLYFANQFEMRLDLCRRLNLQNIQQNCKITVQTISSFSIVLSIFFWIVAITLLIGAAAYFIVILRHKLRKDINKQITMQVSSAVEHYYQLSDTK